MGKWIEMARAMEAKAGCDKRDNRDNRADGGAIVPIVTSVTHTLPADLSDGLRALRSMLRPAMANPQNWSGIVRDCLALADDGWAVQALALGWEPLHLWGVSPAIGGFVDLEGLGVWLNGRRILALTEASCIVQDGPSARSIFNRRPMGGAVLIWDLRKDRGGGR